MLQTAVKHVRINHFRSNQIWLDVCDFPILQAQISISGKYFENFLKTKQLYPQGLWISANSLK